VNIRSRHHYRNRSHGVVEGFAVAALAVISLVGGQCWAVGLVFTAVYKLWQIGYVDADNQSGSLLGRDPW
jgi:hypothetical protein